MDPRWSETTCWSTFKYFIILVVSTYYILCIGWIIKCLNLLIVCAFRENLRKDGRKKFAFIFCVHPETRKTFWKYRRLCWSLRTALKSTAVKTMFLPLPILTGDSKFAHAPVLNENINNALNATQTNTRCVRDIWQHLELCNRHLLPAGSSLTP